MLCYLNEVDECEAVCGTCSDYDQNFCEPSLTLLNLYAEMETKNRYLFDRYLGLSPSSLVYPTMLHCSTEKAPM